MRKTLDLIPVTRVPRFHVPELDTGKRRSLVAWVSFLHWFASDIDQAIVKSYAEFDPSTCERPTGQSMKDWTDYSKADDFDLRIGLTHRLLTNLDVPPPACQPISIRPGLYSLSLSKPLLYASVSALDHFLLLQASENAQKMLSRVRASSTGIKDSEKTVLLHLYAHHWVNKSHEELTLKDLQVSTKLKYSTIQRAINKLFNGEKSVYREQCKDGRVGDAVKQLYAKFIGPSTAGRSRERTLSDPEVTRTHYRHNSQRIPARDDD